MNPPTPFQASETFGRVLLVSILHVEPSPLADEWAENRKSDWNPGLAVPTLQQDFIILYTNSDESGTE
jgi:hypothetical protein